MVVEPTKTFTSMTIPVIMQVECVQVSQVWPGTKIPTGPDFFQVGKVYTMSGRHQIVTLSLKMTVGCCGILEMT
ncbi:hypothetical protein PHAGEALMA_132 [Escherichia phage vB_Eco_Alma]|nr:hypothetical protein PHAGEALMA_132 [Escherichia phage vB_Eco_Alma]